MRWLILLCSVALAELASADSAHQPLDALSEAAERFLLSEVEAPESEPHVEVGRIDERLRMPKCADPLEAFLPPGGRRVGNVTVGVRCLGPQPWTLYVSARVSLMRSVVVLSRPVARGQRLAEADLALHRRDVGRLSGGYLTELTDAIGMQARSPLRTGFVLTSNVLTEPKLVRRGETVTVVAKLGGFEVRSLARALEDGTEGQLIAVENLRSKRVVEGVVSRAGLVQVRM